MSIFGCIGKGFSIAKSSGSLLLTVFGFGFIWTLINLPFVAADGTTEPTAITAIMGILFMLISIFMQAGSIGYVEQVIKQGKSSLATFAQSGKKHYLRLLGLAVVVGLIMLILAVLAVLGFVAGGAQAQPSPIAIGFAVIMAVVGMGLLLFLFLAPYAVVVNGQGVIASLKTSAGIVKRNFVKVLLVGLVLVVIGFGIGFLLGLLTGLISGAIPNRAGQVLGGFLSSAINAYLGIVTTGAFMALFLASGNSSSEPTNAS